MNLAQIHRSRLKVVDESPSLIQNTFIGNIANYITDENDLANVFEISLSDFSNFEIVGNDIRFRMINEYTISHDNLSSLLTPASDGITHFIDRDKKLTRINGNGFRYQDEISWFSAEAVTNLNAQSLRRINNNGRGIFYIRTPELLSIGNEALSRQQRLRRFYAPKVTSYGSTSGSNNVGSALVMNYVHPFLETNNGGGVDGDLVNAQNQNRLTFVPPGSVGDFVEKVTDLSFSNVTSNSFDANFTEPVGSVNAIDFYEVWLDDGNQNPVLLNTFTREISASGDTVGSSLSLSSGTTYKVKIVACDIYWNRSEFSNEITVTTL